VQEVYFRYYDLDKHIITGYRSKCKSEPLFVRKIYKLNPKSNESNNMYVFHYRYDDLPSGLTAFADNNKSLKYKRKLKDVAHLKNYPIDDDTTLESYSSDYNSLSTASSDSIEGNYQSARSKVDITEMVVDNCHYDNDSSIVDWYRNVTDEDSESFDQYYNFSPCHFSNLQSVQSNPSLSPLTHFEPINHIVNNC
jgi:hypothetical protein